MRKALVCKCLLVAAAVFASMNASASSPAPLQLLDPYPVPGSPFRVAIEAPGRVWFTLPAENAIGNLVVHSSGAHDVNLYQLPTAESEPYDIAYAARTVWVTERVGNKIARFDPLTGRWTEYPIPTADSQPTGLVVLEGQPTQVWFAERKGNKLGRLTIFDSSAWAPGEWPYRVYLPLVFRDDPTASIWSEFPLPSGAQFINAEMEDVAATASDAVWFTLPGAGLIGRFNLSLWPTPQALNFLNPRNYPWLYPGKTLRPWQIKLDKRGLPWITEPGTNQLMRYNPNTVVSFEHYPIPTSDSGLNGLDITHLSMVTDEIIAWYTARAPDRVGQLHRVDYSAPTREIPLPASAPTDIAVDAEGCAWIAANGTDHIVRWCAPYFYYSYLPLALKE